MLSVSDEEKIFEREFVVKAALMDVIDHAMSDAVLPVLDQAAPCSLHSHMVVEVSKMLYQFSPLSHSADLTHRCSNEQREFVSFVSHSFALDPISSSRSSPVLSDNGENLPLPTVSSMPAMLPLSPEIPLYKKDLWKHLSQVKKTSFKSIEMRPKKRPVDELTSSIQKLRIASAPDDLTSQFKKLKLSQQDHTQVQGTMFVSTNVPQLPTPAGHSSNGKEKVPLVPNLNSVQVPDASDASSQHARKPFAGHRS